MSAAVADPAMSTNRDLESQGVGGVNPEEEEVKSGLKPIGENTPLELFTGGVAGTAVATSLGAMIVEQSAIVVVAGILSCGVGPYAYYQQTQLTDIRNLKETHAAIETEVNHLKEENERLEQNIEELTATVDRLEDVEEALEIITSTQGQNVEQFQEQVEKNKQILGKMENNLRANVLQNLLSVIIRSDTDSDHQIDPEEIDDLMKRIKRINGVKLNEEKFRASIMESGGKLSAVMKVIKNLLNKDSSDEEKIFDIAS